MVKILGILGVDRLGISDILSQVEELASLNPAGPLCSQPREPEPAPSLLAFSHPIVDPYLTEVRHPAEGVMLESSVSQSIFQELAHWHNSRTPLDAKYVAKPRGFYAAKRYQKLMSDTMAYSASLTGASGKIIEPEVVTVTEEPARKKRPEKIAYAAAKKPKGKDARMDAQEQKSNKQMALEQADARRREKLNVVSRSVAAA